MVLYTSLLGLLAQLVEQLTLNQRVEGSSPSRPTNNPTPHTGVWGVFLNETSITLANRMRRKFYFIQIRKKTPLETNTMDSYAIMSMFTRSNKGDH